MDKEPLIRLVWRGHETIEAIPTLLKQAKQIEIELPANYNHALLRTLNPDAPVAGLEDIDASGGPGLLTDIATVNGLEELAALVEILSSAHASVQIVSPPTLVITVPSPK